MPVISMNTFFSCSKKSSKMTNLLVVDIDPMKSSQASLMPGLNLAEMCKTKSWLFERLSQSLLFLSRAQQHYLDTVNGDERKILVCKEFSLSSS